MEAQGKRAVKKRFKVFSVRAGMDMPFFFLVLILLVIGLVMLFSASYPNAYYQKGDSYFFIKKQVVYAIAGVVLMWLISYFDYHHLHKWALPIFGISTLMLVAVLFMPAINEVHRWFQVGGFSFQPSKSPNLPLHFCLHI